MISIRRQFVGQTVVYNHVVRPKSNVPTHTQRLYGSTEPSTAELAALLNASLGVDLKFAGKPRADYLDRDAGLESLRLYATDGSGLNPRTDSEDEHWFISDVTVFCVVLVSYGLEADVSDFHDRLVSSGLRFDYLATCSHETLG